ncbi:MAG: hypothetical protein GY943_16250 [Chloroflexi bacterium]|nr:hypothetical protein [Chloroflexota bacterium]
MGRTLATTNQLILNEIENFKHFRRALRATDQQLFDELFVAARQHTAAISMANHALPLESVLLAILLEQQRRLRLLESRLLDDAHG